MHLWHNDCHGQCLWVSCDVAECHHPRQAHVALCLCNVVHHGRYSSCIHHQLGQLHTYIQYRKDRNTFTTRATYVQYIHITQYTYVYYICTYVLTTVRMNFNMTSIVKYVHSERYVRTSLAASHADQHEKNAKELYTVRTSGECLTISLIRVAMFFLTYSSESTMSKGNGEGGTHWTGAIHNHCMYIEAD